MALTVQEDNVTFDAFDECDGWPVESWLKLIAVMAGILGELLTGFDPNGFFVMHNGQVRIEYTVLLMAIILYFFDFLQNGTSRPLFSLLLSVESIQFLQQIKRKKCPPSIWCLDSNPQPSD